MNVKSAHVTCEDKTRIVYYLLLEVYLLFSSALFGVSLRLCILE